MLFQISLAYSNLMQRSTIKSAITVPTSMLKAYRYPMGYSIGGIYITPGIPLPRNPGLEKLVRIQGLGFSTAIRCPFMCLDTKDNDNRTPLSSVATVELCPGRSCRCSWNGKVPPPILRLVTAERLSRRQLAMGVGQS